MSYLNYIYYRHHVKFFANILRKVWIASEPGIVPDIQSIMAPITGLSSIWRWFFGVGFGL